MPSKEQFTTVIGQINDATNAIAAELTALKEKVTAAGLTADAEAEILAGLTSAADRLTGIATDPGNPVPPVEEPVDPPPPVEFPPTEG